MRGLGCRRLRTLMAVGAVVALGGCWFQPGADARRSGFSLLDTAVTKANVASLHPVWTRTLGGDVQDPAVTPSGLYVMAGSPVAAGSLTLVDPATGTTTWTDDLFGESSYRLPAAPTVMGETVYLPMRGVSPVLGNAVERFDATTGQRQSSISRGAATDVIGRDGVLVGADIGVTPTFPSFAVTSVWAERPGGTGSWSQVLWSGTYSGGPPPWPTPTSAALASDRLVMGDGASVEARHFEQPSGCPTLPNGDPDCAPLWSASVSAPVAGHPVLSPDEATVYAAAGDQLVALDTANGTRRWTGTLGANASAAPALANGYVFVPTSSGELDVFTAGCGADTCKPLWTATTAGSIIRPPAVTAGAVVYVASADHTVTAFDALGCAPARPPCPPLWSVDTGATITGGPVPALGKVFVGTDDGRLVAYGL
jgi:outer membrane protein assembly factor BamB